MKELSVIVPFYNEEGNIKELHQEIVEICEKNNYKYEIIFVDDGSSDKTYEIGKSLSPVKMIRLKKNFGQTAALDAGIKNATKDYIITMDGDRQNDPNDFPVLIKYLEDNNLDVVSGWRKNRKDTFLKKFISRGAYRIRRVFVKDGIHDSGCTLKIYKRECFDNVTLYGEIHRFIPALLMSYGNSVGEVVVNHRSRVAGVTKYTMTRTIKGFIDMLSVAFYKKFAVRPLHLFGAIGFFFFFLSFISLSVTLYTFYQGQGMSETAWPLLTVFLFLAGLQFFMFGITIDILMKNRYETTKERSYGIKEIIDN
ncbi:MAG: glycosyltransferase family 2 protein [Ignavibacteriae bacterium]|nr:glycosyltransferase family 2 protein [Ignavibacteriota bacterium]